MTTQKINFVLACFTCCALLAACDKERVTDYDILHIEGVSWACNITTSYATFGASSESEEKPSVVLPAYDGDLLYMNLDDQEFYYRYTSGDGKHLLVTFDTLNAKSVSLNGKLEFMELSDHASWEYLNGLSDPVRKQLSTLYITEALTLENLSVSQSNIRNTN